MIRSRSFSLLLQSVCQTCGQFHKSTLSHLYDYYQTVDEDLVCPMCSQPLVDPLDTRCGHTFCARCMRNYLKEHQICPIDGLTLTHEDVLQASLIIRRLLDKLLVVCPNVDYCEDVLPRAELESHLKHRCCGAVVKCVHAPMGCTFQGPRSALHSHLWECSFNNQIQSSLKKPINDGEITTIDIQRGCFDLGISIVGGCDTPLMGTVIQEIFPYSVVEKDDRLRPGDQILEVNGDDLTQATHVEAQSALMQMYPICRLTVYRDKAEENRPIEKEEILQISIAKKPGKILGIKLVGKKNGPGLFILDVIPGSLAYVDDRLIPNDRILEINCQDMMHGNQDEAAQIIQVSVDKVQFVISRKTRPQTPDLIRSTAQDNPAFEPSPSDENVRSLPLSDKCREKTVTVNKSTDESLGISVSGGMGSQRGDVPLYVTNITTHGCLSRTKQIKKGDIILSINGQSLLSLSHIEAVELMKNAAGQSPVTLQLLDGPESNDGFSNFVPSWMYWLQLPEMCQNVKVVSLLRGRDGTWGFSVVGGCDSTHGSQPIFVKTVVNGTAAATQGKIRCGDVILSVNNHCFRTISHISAVQILRGIVGTATISLVSWPGTIV